jgi:hypothetical protein
MIVESTEAQIKHESPNIANAVLVVNGTQCYYEKLMLNK